MLEHFFVSDFDGALHDTRQPGWTTRPLRANYKRHHVNVRNVADFKATLRAGAFAWPGGYPLFLLCDDGATLCFDCGHKEARNVMDAIASKRSTGWRVIACDVNWEDPAMVCDNCNKTMESAYGDD